MDAEILRLDEAFIGALAVLESTLTEVLDSLVREGDELFNEDLEDTPPVPGVNTTVKPSGFQTIWDEFEGRLNRFVETNRGHRSVHISIYNISETGRHQGRILRDYGGNRIFGRTIAFKPGVNRNEKTANKYYQ